jgi:hypothetical protein
MINRNKGIRRRKISSSEGPAVPAKQVKVEKTNRKNVFRSIINSLLKVT